MSEPAREGRVLALIEAEFRADDPALSALFDAFATRSAAPTAPRRWPAGREQWTALAKSVLACLLVPLTIMAVLALLGGNRRAAAGRPACPPLTAFGRPLPASAAGCLAAGRAHRAAPVPAQVRPPAGAGTGALAPITGAYADAFGHALAAVTAVDTWAVRQGRAVRAQICQSIPLPAGIACP